MYDPENEPEPPKVEQVNDFYKFCWAITATFFSGDRGSVLGQIFKISSHIIECLNEIETNNYVQFFFYIIICFDLVKAFDNMWRNFENLA